MTEFSWDIDKRRGQRQGTIFGFLHFTPTDSDVQSGLAVGAVRVMRTVNGATRQSRHQRRALGDGFIARHPHGAVNLSNRLRSFFTGIFCHHRSEPIAYHYQVVKHFAGNPLSPVGSAWSGWLLLRP